MRESLLWGFKYHYDVSDNSVTVGQVRRDQKRGVFSELVIESPLSQSFFQIL